MLLHLLFFPLFLIIPYSMGALFTFTLSKINNVGRNKKTLIAGIGLQGFLGLFLLGMTGVIFNFFQPLASTFFLVTIFSLTLSGVMVLIKNLNHPAKTEYYCFLAVSFIFALLAGSMNPGYDGGLYHLPHQLWLRNESVVIGLANLHGRFGFSSMYEYISAPLWIKGNNFILLSYLQASFIVFFILFLIEQSRHSNGTHQVLLSGVVINLVAFHQYVHSGYTYTDLPAGVMFATAFLYGHWLANKEQPAGRNEWSIFTILLLAAIFFKISSILLIIWFVLVLFYRILWKRDQLQECIIGLVVPTGFVLFWLFKNIITTGCVLYPMSSSCMDVSWSAKVNAVNDAKWVTAWARHPASGLYSLQDNSWFSTWWFSNYKSFLTKISYAGIFVGILYSGLALRAKFTTVRLFDLRFLGTLGFIIISFLFWFWKSPTPRFGIGAFILFFPVLFLFFYGYDFKMSKKINSILRSGIIAGLLLFSFRIALPWKRISMENALTFSSITVPTPQVQTDLRYGVRPITGDQCWLIPECAPPYDRPPLSSWHGIKAFYSHSDL